MERESCFYAVNIEIKIFQQFALFQSFFISIYITGLGPLPDKLIINFFLPVKTFIYETNAFAMKSSEKLNEY